MIFLVLKVCPSWQNTIGFGHSPIHTAMSTRITATSMNRWLTLWEPILENLSPGLQYVKGRYLFSFHQVWSEKGLDYSSTSTNYGGDIFRSNADMRMDYGNVTGQGLGTSRYFAEFKLGYLLSPDSRWCLELGISERNIRYEATNFTDGFINTNTMFHIGIRTLLYNQYLDF